jgi:hypothetical protein
MSVGVSYAGLSFGKQDEWPKPPTTGYMRLGERVLIPFLRVGVHPNAARQSICFSWSTLRL